MIKVNFYTYNNYVTDSLYQWDLNQDLVIHGLNLPTAPEIHFSNANMDRAIVRQATLESGVVTVGIPNSLLQDALTIKAYVGLYEGDTFKVVEVIEIPIKAKARPYDYQISDSDEEIYSFKKLENMINEFNRYNAVIIRHSAIDTTINEGLVYYFAGDENGYYSKAPFDEGMIFTTCTHQNATLGGQTYHQVAIDSATGSIYTRALEEDDLVDQPFSVSWVKVTNSDDGDKTPMTFIDVVSELPGDANEGDVYSVTPWDNVGTYDDASDVRFTENTIYFPGWSNIANTLYSDVQSHYGCAYKFVIDGNTEFIFKDCGISTAGPDGFEMSVSCTQSEVNYTVPGYASVEVFRLEGEIRDNVSYVYSKGKWIKL